MKYHIILLILFFILVITSFIGSTPKQRSTDEIHEIYEYFEETPVPNILDITYPPRDHFKKHILASSFLKGLTTTDLKARNVKSLEVTDYANTYFNAYTTFTERDKQKIAQVIQLIRETLKDFPKFVNTRWNFVKVRKDIENNYPHTIGDMIVLNELVMQNDIESLTKTIVHERFHVLQRLYPIHFQELYEAMGFLPVSIQRPENTRSNPDVDMFLYVYEPSQLIPIQLYHNNPSSLAQSSPRLLDSDGVPKKSPQPTNKLFGLPSSFYCQLEHPAEISACLLTEIMTNKDFLEKESKNGQVKTAWLWLSKYFS